MYYTHQVNKSKSSQTMASKQKGDTFEKIEIGSNPKFFFTYKQMKARVMPLYTINSGVVQNKRSQ